MPVDSYNLAIDMAGRAGSITLGCGDTMIVSHDLPDTRRPPRHRIALIPAIDQLLYEQSVRADQLEHVYLSMGPGSFTGLRIAVATARTLAQVSGVRLVAVPTLDVIADRLDCRSSMTDHQHLAVCLSVKADTCYAGFYQRHQATWVPTNQPTVMAWSEVMSSAPRPLSIVADRFPNAMSQGPSADVSWLGGADITRGSESVWNLGRRAARQHQFTDQSTLLPLYVRPPEAEVLWQQRLAKSAAASTPGRSA